MDKPYDLWNIEKKLIDAEDQIKVFPNERDVWWCALGCNIGKETNGKHEDFRRLILVVKVFNRHMVWCLPITSQRKNDRFHYEIPYPDGLFVVKLSQLKVISTKRFIRKMHLVEKKPFDEVRSRLRDFLL